eukprot:m.116217 g.116217  ORF g.116217 m.116217 type:complete len:1058 (-) comp13125_c0_seq1:126-3299(-)
MRLGNLEVRGPPMRSTALLLLAGAACSASASASTPLPAPQRLMVEYLPPPPQGILLTVGTQRPRFSFVPHSDLEHPGAGVAMTHYRITVIPEPRTPALQGWDSGMVAATSAVAVPCGVNLTVLASYTWTAQWWGAAPGVNGTLSDPTPSGATSAEFVIGPESTWPESDWYGGSGQNEIRLRFGGATPNGDVAGSGATKLFVAAPGGAVVTVNGEYVSDPSGLSAWIQNSANMPYVGYDLRPTANTSLAIVIQIGTGFFTDSRWRSHQNTIAAVRMLVTDANGKALPLDGGVVEGRIGRVVSSDPFVGGIFNTTLPDNAGWGPVATVKSPSSAGLGGPLRAFAVQPAQTAPGAAQALRASVVSVEALPPAPAPRRCQPACDPTSSSSTKGCDGGCDPVTPPQRRWAFGFDRLIVGTALLNPGAFSVSCDENARSGNCTGEITLQYCEVFNQSNYSQARTPGIPWPQFTGLCQPLAGLSVVADTFIVGPTLGATPSAALRPSFTWHSFQHVIVSVSSGVTFNPANALTAEWTTMDAEPTGVVTFGGGPDADLLNRLAAMVQAGQLSNMAAFVPTDCPSREKHAWLGDALDVAEEMLYNFWGAPVYELFLDTIRAEQEVGGPGDGNLPVNVPAGSPQRPMDISWTAAYPLIAHWLYWYVGDIGVVRNHWPTLKRYVDGQRRQKSGNATNPAVPDFWNFGDWCAIESRTVCTPNTGPPAAAANFILAVEAMAAMAAALNETADQMQYTSWLSAYRVAFDQTYWQSNLSSYGKTPLEVQSMSSVALGAGAVPTGKVDTVRSALVADIASRDHHLTVGATGQKWLLRTLSAGGASGHEVALAVATQRSFPGWGSWIERGATTCWEDWDGIQGPPHPGNKQHPINPPTHNHIFLCGGLGEWMYRSLGGIAPTSPGYGTVAIAPQISPTRDPASVNSSVQTVRGKVTSNWTRHDTAGCVNGRTPVVSLRVAVPVGALGSIAVPLLGRPQSSLSLDGAVLRVTQGEPSRTTVEPTALWPWRDVAVSGAGSVAPWLRAPPQVDVERDVIVIETAAAELELTLWGKCE